MFKARPVRQIYITCIDPDDSVSEGMVMQLCRLSVVTNRLQMTIMYP